MIAQKIVVIGATSSIAVAFARQIAPRAAAFHLIARDADELARLAGDLNACFALPVSWSCLDLEQTESFDIVIKESISTLGTIDGVFFASGYLGDQAEAQLNTGEACRIAQINYLSAIRLLMPYADYLERKGNGFMVIISSVAGDRGRPSNYLYGAAKGALSLFAQGLRARLAKRGVEVMTVKPGFVDTKMTFGKPGMFLVADPESVGKAIIRALDLHTDVLYVPWFWFYIMTIIKMIPEAIFKRLNL